ncbi:MAG: hypothetical protein RR100_15145, partial [Comamonas sp.]
INRAAAALLGAKPAILSPGTNIAPKCGAQYSGHKKACTAGQLHAFILIAVSLYESWTKG